MIDLHSHTTASDGQHSPDELLALAAQAGVKALAVTDHDTVAGLAGASAAALRFGIELVAGIELSAFLDNREVHVLGHFVDPASDELRSFSALLKTERASRMEAMVVKMNGLGYPITMADVLAIAGEAQLGRPHLARALVERRFCSSTKDAFDRFLGAGKQAFVDRYRLSCEEAIALIDRAGGVATVAHPGVSRIEKMDLSRLKAVGLTGLEVYHPDHVPSAREKFLGFARSLELIPTAGSDFHGEKVAPGRALGAATMPPMEFQALRQRARAPAA